MLAWDFSVAKLYFAITLCLCIFFLLSILIDIILTKTIYIRNEENKFETIPQCRE